MFRRVTAIILFLCLPCCAASAVNLDETVCLPIVMYHSVRPSNGGKDSITPWELESDLKYYKDAGYESVTVSEVIDFVSGEGNLPEKPIILSFDDAYYNNYKYVYPLLQKYNMRIVMSVIVNAVDKFSIAPSTNIDYSHVTWDQLCEMEQSGYVEIQNHSYDLHAYRSGRVGCGQKKGEAAANYDMILTEDVIKSQLRIYEMTGALPNTFTYPYGKYNDMTSSILKNLGFNATLSCDYGINLLNREGVTDLFNLKRICRAHNQSAKKVLSEAYKTLKYR